MSSVASSAAAHASRSSSDSTSAGSTNTHLLIPRSPASRSAGPRPRVHHTRTTYPPLRVASPQPPRRPKARISYPVGSGLPQTTPAAGLGLTQATPGPPGTGPASSSPFGPHWRRHAPPCGAPVPEPAGSFHKPAWLLVIRHLTTPGVSSVHPRHSSAPQNRATPTSLRTPLVTPSDIRSRPQQRPPSTSHSPCQDRPGSAGQIT